LQPDGPLAGFKGVRNAYLECLIMSVFVIPVVAIIFGIGIAAFGMWTDHQRKTQMLAQLHRERMAAIEKGTELPPMTFDVSGDSTPPATNTANPARVLRTGVFMLSFGIVLYFALDTVGASQAAVFGLIPATLGLANLAYAAVLFHNERKAAAEKERLRLPPL
jgi:uncharacterized membrane protein YidH (DUF202 family)